MLPAHVTLVEVGPRDGLQNEPQPVATADKIELVRLLEHAGLRHIEVTSFVSPKWVPQMADASAVLAGVRVPGVRDARVRHSALVPNLKGLETALAGPRESWPDEIVVFTAASESFCQRNTNCSIEESLERFAPVVARARAEGLGVRGSI
jgi:hydroxymethylglutaryl-CoA lyase